MQSSTPDLWVDKYRPQRVTDIIDNSANVQQLLHWLKTWSKDREEGVLITGPAGTGKTSSVTVICKELGLRVIECNASDCRNESNVKRIFEPYQRVGCAQPHAAARPSKKSKVAGETRVTGTTKARPRGPMQQNSLARFFQAATPSTTGNNNRPLRSFDTVILMDEVDGLEGNSDRGGLKAVVDCIGKSTIPVICMGNDCADPRKFGTLQKRCLCIAWMRPSLPQIMRRLRGILETERVQVPPNDLHTFLQNQHGDVRQILNELQFWTRNNSAPGATVPPLGIGTGGHLMAVQKDVERHLFDMASSMVATIPPKSDWMEDRMTTYFQDVSMMPLFMHENYPDLLAQRSGPPTTATSLDILEKMSDIATSFSTADMVDREMHETQAFELAPAHAVFSILVPAAHCSMPKGCNAPRMKFPDFLGKTSKGNARVKNSLRLRNAFLLTDGSFGSLEWETVVLPVLRTVMLELLANSDNDAIDAHDWLASTQRAHALSHSTLSLDANELDDLVADGTISVRESELLACAMRSGEISPSDYAELHALRSGEVCSGPVLNCYMRGIARTAKSWRQLLVNPAHAVHHGTGHTQIAQMAKHLHLTKDDLEVIWTWHESFVSSAMHHKQRIPVKQKAAFTRTLNQVVDGSDGKKRKATVLADVVGSDDAVKVVHGDALDDEIGDGDSQSYNDDIEL